MATILAWGAVELVLSERDAGSIIAAGVPTWVAQLALPIGFTLIALRLAWRAGTSWPARALGFAGIAVGAVLIRYPALLERRPAWPGLVDRSRRAAVGAPIFAILGGAAVLLFMSDGVTPATVLIETYSLSVSPTLPAIPLFTLAGFLLAEGSASARLLRVFRALVRLDSRRHGGRLRRPVLVLHRLHRRVGRDDSARWAACCFRRCSRTAIASAFRSAC